MSRIVGKSRANGSTMVNGKGSDNRVFFFEEGRFRDSAEKRDGSRFRSTDWGGFKILPGRAEGFIFFPGGDMRMRRGMWRFILHGESGGIGCKKLGAFQINRYSAVSRIVEK